MLSFSASPGDCSTVNRCNKYKPQVIREARYLVGMNAPYWLFLGQIEQESRCDAGATAFDGGRGLGQFMPATARWIHDKEDALQEISAKPAAYDPRWSIRALILYDWRLYNSGICPGWYFALRSYNGGQGLLNKEIRRAASCTVTLVERECSRKVVRLKSGHMLDFCTVNIEYPYQVIRKGEKYK